jgi:hypothetical protein
MQLTGRTVALVCSVHACGTAWREYAESMRDRVAAMAVMS